MTLYRTCGILDEISEVNQNGVNCCRDELDTNLAEPLITVGSVVVSLKGSLLEQKEFTTAEWLYNSFLTTTLIFNLSEHNNLIFFNLS